MTETKFHKGDSTSAGQWLVPVRDEKGEMDEGKEVYVTMIMGEQDYSKVETSGGFREVYLVDVILSAIKRYAEADEPNVALHKILARADAESLEAERLVGLARKELARAEHGIEDARKARNERCARATILRELIDEIEAP